MTIRDKIPFGVIYLVVLLNITYSQWHLVGSGLAALIICLAYRMRLSRARIQEFLYDWLGVSTQRSLIMDKRGEGVPIIITESEQISGRRPEYLLLDDAELKFSIFAAKSPHGEDWKGQVIKRSLKRL